MTVIGPELKVGDKAPDFKTVDNSLKPVDLAGTGNNIRIFSVVPSLDTPVCSTQTHKFDTALAELKDILPASEYRTALDWTARNDPDPANRAGAQAQLKGLPKTP